MKSIKEIVKKNLKQVLNRYDYIQNINYYSEEQKKILIVYITNPLTKNLNTELTHTNIHESLSIIRTFIEKDFCIDVIDSLESAYEKLIKKEYYDYIFGLGEIYYYACSVNPNAKKIMYITEASPRFAQKQEKERLEYYNERHGKMPKASRTSLFYKDEQFDNTDKYILIGNEHTKNTFDYLNKSIYTISATGLINVDYKCNRNVNESRRNFLWFGSYGAIHKGLDVLVEAFSELQECNLFIAGLRKEEEKYIKINSPNINNVGFVNIYSKEFIELMDKCSFVILPSCSEGMATSVLTCMNHGLVPIVTKECGIDTENMGIIIEDYHIESLKSIIRECSKIDLLELGNMHKVIYESSRKKYCSDKFKENFNKIIDKYMEEA